MPLARWLDISSFARRSCHRQTAWRALDPVDPSFAVRYREPIARLFDDFFKIMPVVAVREAALNRNTRLTPELVAAPWATRMEA